MNDFSICLYTDGIGALTTLDDLGLIFPYKPTYEEPRPEFSGDGSPVVDGWDTIEWVFPSLSAAQVATLEYYKNKQVYVKSLKQGQYVTRAAWLTGWKAEIATSALRTKLTITFTKVRAA